jgi:hypothetical protein
LANDNEAGPMLWRIEGRLSFDQVWKMEVEEAMAAQGNCKIIGMYKVAGQRRVLAIIEIDPADDLDRIIMGKLLCANIWSLRQSGHCARSRRSSRTARRGSQPQSRHNQDLAAEPLMKAAQTGEEADIDGATAQMERALRVEGWL